MIWVDWLLLAALMVSILIGILRGFTREVLGLSTWIVAIIAALLFAPGAADYLERQIPVPSIRLASAYGLVFFLGLVLGAIVTNLLASMVRKSALSGLDRMIGGGFGLLRGVLLAVVLVWLIGLTPARQDPWWHGSAFVGPLDVLAQGFTRLMPDDWAKRLKTPAVASRKGT